jgi:O-antigen/teichoic acid export membrane protein
MSSLKSAAATGAKWLTGSRGIVAVLQFVQVAILAHLLDAEAFGLMATTVVVIGLAQAFGDMGLSNSIIAHQRTTRSELSTLFWANQATGLIVALLVLASTPLVAAFYGEPALRGLIPWAALSFAIAPLGQQSLVLLQKRLDFKPIAGAEVLGAVASIVISTGAALLGAGAVALVWGNIAYTCFSALFLCAVGWKAWRPQLHFSYPELRPHVGFGAYQMGERFITFLASNVDYILVGMFLGPQALGVYAIAYQLVVKPTLLINPILTRVAFPAFAKRQDDDRALEGGYVQVIRLVAFVTVPIMLGIAVTAPALVPTFLGDKWDDAIVLIQILTGVGVARALANPVGSLLLAKKRADLGFFLSIVFLVLVAAAVRVGVEGGVNAVAWTLAGATVLMLGIWLVVIDRACNVSWRRVVGATLRPAAIGAAMVAATVAFDSAIGSRIGSDGARLAALVAIGAASYIALVLHFERDYLADLRALFVRSRPAAPPAPVPAQAGQELASAPVR